MSLVREIITTVVDGLLPGVVDGINSVSDFLFQSVITTFAAYKSKVTTDPGWGTAYGLLGLLVALVFLGTASTSRTECIRIGEFLNPVKSLFASVWAIPHIDVAFDTWIIFV